MRADDCSARARSRLHRADPRDADFDHGAHASRCARGVGLDARRAMSNRTWSLACTSGRAVAIKVLRSARPDDDRVARFFNEARAATAVRHPGIVDVYDGAGHPYAAARRLVSEVGAPLRSLRSAAHALCRRGLPSAEVWLARWVDTLLPGERAIAARAATPVGRTTDRLPHRQPRGVCEVLTMRDQVAVA